MMTRFAQLLFALLLTSSHLAHASWTSFSLDQIDAPLSAPRHIDIATLDPFALGTTIELGVPSVSPGTPLFSFRNATGFTLDDFHVTITCVQTDLNACNGGQVFGPSQPSSDIFSQVSDNVVPSQNAGIYTWNFDFSGGDILPGELFAIVDKGNALGLPPAVLGITARASVPEPSSALLTLSALAFVGLISRRRRVVKCPIPPRRSVVHVLQLRNPQHRASPFTRHTSMG
ncbi:hypothetical protein RD110_22495 [Rhodoferax koreense]|uniref:Ice-binding protein C-terminal domain-containing protein n=1 Tax=Rhodoferax koreensis TaxID=1842727 RepID=A0A1P8K0U5_9BURK|nr:PEP-CTERM sorting domain-containing protein [Rhodoferax koreense]APW39634.1 hypothetical protein RD110_22495 [Rhodoferax koreense]